MAHDVRTWCKWRKNEWKQANALYLSNFKPWCVRNKKHEVSNQSFFKQLHLILRDNAVLYGLEHQAPKNKSEWKWNIEKIIPQDDDDEG